MNIPLPDGEYFKKIEVNDTGLEIEFAKRKKVALLFISLNDRYWPYLGQVIRDCRQNFLPQHHVDYLVWTDYSEETKKQQLDTLETLFTTWKASKDNAHLDQLLFAFSQIVRLYQQFYPEQIKKTMEELAAQGTAFRYENGRYWIESARQLTDQDIEMYYLTGRNILILSQSDMDAALKDVTITETAPIEWPAPTLMRYHLFLQLEEKLKEYDYILYLDADMRVVAKISDEVFSEGLTAAEHPMYSLRREYTPPYEPNSDSTAYINRPGKVIDENGQPRFKPYYYAGGFQGGVAKDFIEAMQVMKANIDKDYTNNYVAIWNDESHFNKYMSEYKGPTVVLSPSYVYPDSLIKEYYEPLWGRSYEPKIITLTKPFTLSVQAGTEINKMIQK